ncbi:hypothetical protein HOD88_03605 [archaeon]|jgi:hypothetical protein|nr:hypothetical protein [archaeon]
MIKRKKKGFSFEFKLAFYLIIFILFSMVNTYLLLSQDSPAIKLTGNAGLTSATISLVVQDAAWINITEPLNTTYDFFPAEDLEINLSVHPFNFEPAEWWFSVWNERSSLWIIENSSFSPNITFIAERGLNTVYVYSNSTLDVLYSEEVTFFVNVSNSAPVVYLNDSIYVCEGESLFYEFNVSDEDINELSLSIAPSEIFFMYPQTIFSTDNPLYNPNLIYGYIYGNSNATAYLASSAELTEEQAGGFAGSFRTYLRNISVDDGNNVDSIQTNITVIEINDLLEKEIIGVQTVYTRGDNATLHKTISVNDSESGMEDSPQISFNISFNSGPELFGVTNDGIIDFTADNSTPLGIHNVSICAMDMELPDPYEDIEVYCNQTGLSNSVCEDFTITVVDDNRPPTIIDSFPNQTFIAVGEKSILLNVTTYDPDHTIPDVYWYVDSVQKDYASGNLTDSFNYAFSCGLSGLHEIEVVITDGLLNDSFAWEVILFASTCPEGATSGGGGGGGGCSPQWICEDWDVCQNAKDSLDFGVLAGEDYRLIQYECEQQGFDERFCGFQLKTCTDLLECNYLANKPAEIQSCYYTENPSCEDGLKNCHDGACEILIDCGGTCGACPTCTDGIKNQKEEGVDCGGPCPWKCEVEQPFAQRKGTLYIFIGLIILLLALIISRIVKIVRVKKSLGDEEKKVLP